MLGWTASGDAFRKSINTHDAIETNGMTYNEREARIMGRASNSDRSSLARRRVVQRDQQPADWGAVDPNLLAGAITAISSQGGAIRFGYTRDGGAYAVGLLGDGEPRTEYIRPNDDIEEYLRQLVTAWTD